MTFFLIKLCKLRNYFAQLTFQPLDTSTQRERINVSRSGTMGVRRPPTRRHTPVTPAPIVSTSPDDSEVEIKDEIIVDSDDNLRNTPPPPQTRSSVMMNHASGLSIVEFKDITPKFRGVMVGFPVEIQLELQSRLRGSASSHMERRNGMDSDDDDDVLQVPVRREGDDKSGPYQNDTAKKRESSPARQFGLSSSSSEKKGSTFGFPQRKKSYELESFDSHADSSRLLSSNNNNNSNKFASNYLNLFPPSDDDDNHHHHHHHHHHHGGENVPEEIPPMDQHLRRHNSPSPIIQSPSPPPWTNFYDKMKPGNERGGKMFENNNPFMSYDENTFEKSTPIPIQIEGRAKGHSVMNTFESDKYFGQDNYMVTPSKLNFSAKSGLGQGGEAYDTRREEERPPSPQQEPLSPSPPLLSPSLERSRRLLQMLHETPTVMSKMSGGKYSHSEEDKWGQNNNNNNEENSNNEEEEWQTQRQLSFLNDSLSRILEAGRTTAPRKSDQGQQEKYSNMVENVYTFSNQKYSSRECDEEDDDDNDEVDINGNLRPAQVSQTWISSADMNKPSQKVRDKDVTTSISATHDHFRRGAKKVEFCKTEVHFTADSGKFHIVETDENKPSTSHLFRRKKKDRTKSGESEIATTPTNQTSTESTPSSTSLLSQKSGESVWSDEKNQKHWLFGKDYSDKRTSSHLLQAPEVPEPQAEQPLPSSSSHTKNDSQSNKPSLFYDDYKPSEPPTATLDESYILEIQPRVAKSRLMPTASDTDSPSHNIFSNYEELKIQRYLSRLKSPPSQHQSEAGKQTFNFDLDDQNQPNTYRFNNVLYENGSFVPLATRRSLIEMNNTNKKGGRDMSESDNRSSVSITPENPVATQPIARMEARVATGRPNPQITSVELRYDFDNERGSGVRRNHMAESPPSSPPPPFHSYRSALPPLHEREDKKKQHFSDHSRHLKKKEEQTPSHHPSSETSYSSRSERISDLIKRSYYKNPDLEWSPNDSNNNNINKRLNTTLANNNLAMSAATISSTSNNKSASKSIVTIGDYDGNTTSVTPALVNADPSPEPILSMDHTWKGPAYSNVEDASSDRKTSNARSLTLLKLGHHSSEQPEWISKARNREHRILDWDSVGKQPTYSSTPSQPPEQPPWVDDFIRPRAKTVLADRIVPKVSAVVYPWQRHPVVTSSLSRNESRSDDGRMNEEEDEDGMKSHIVSIVPTPSFITSKYNRKLEPIGGGGRSGPTSLPDLPVLQLSNKEEVVDRDSDSILVHSSTQVMKNRTSGGGRSKGGRGTKEPERSLPPPPPPPSATLSSSRSSNPNKLVTSETESEQRPTTRNSVKSGIHSTTISKMAKVVSSNKAALNDPVTSGGGGRKSGAGGGRGRTEVKSSVTSGDSTTTRNNKATSDKQSITTTTTSSTPIHRHPLVKVSKLPVRKNLAPKSSSGEGKGMKGSSKGGSKENPGQYKINDKLLSVSCRLI